MEKLYRMIYPMRVVLVSASAEGKDNIMTAAWCFPLSMDPPMFGVSMTRKKYTYELIQKSKKFAINIPGEDLKEQTIICGRNSGRDMDKFKEANFTKEEGKTGTALIKECLSSIECEFVDEFEAGDHVTVVGKAVDVVKRKEGKGLYHLGGDELLSI